MQKKEFDMDVDININNLAGSYYYLVDDDNMLIETHLIGEKNEKMSIRV